MAALRTAYPFIRHLRTEAMQQPSSQHGATPAEKGLAILKSVATRHEGRDGDHAWRRCRRCLALQELDGREGRTYLRAFLAQVDTVPDLMVEVVKLLRLTHAELAVLTELVQQPATDSLGWIDGMQRRIAELLQKIEAR